MPRKPSPLTVGALHARVVRGPRTDGRYYWRARRYVDGKEDSPWTGWATRDEALRELAALLASGTLDAPRNPYEDVRTFRDLLECWIATRKERSDLARGTVDNYVRKARYLADGLGDVLLERADVVTLESYRDRRLRAGVATSTLVLEFNILRIAWRWGREVGVCPPRSLPRVALRARRLRPAVTPTPEHVRAVAARLTGWARVAFLVQYATGARTGEVAALTWEAVDLEAGTVRLCGKTGPRVVPLAVEALEALKTLPRDGGGPFWGVRRDTVRLGLGGHITRACREAGIPGFPPYGLRRAAVDRFARAGVDIGTAAAFLGHSPMIMLQHYRRVSLDDMRGAVAAARLGALDGGQVVPFNRGGGRGG